MPRLFASFALPPPRPPTCVVGGRACQLPKNKINYGTPVFMPREGGRTSCVCVREREKDERKRGLVGTGRREGHRRDYRTKLRTKVIRPWRPERIRDYRRIMCGWFYFSPPRNNGLGPGKCSLILPVSPLVLSSLLLSLHTRISRRLVLAFTHFLCSKYFSFNYISKSRYSKKEEI